MFELIRGGHVLIFVSAIGSAITGISLLGEAYITQWRQRLAYAGDMEIGLKIILPCYRPLFYGLAVLFFLLAGGQILSLLDEYNIHNAYFVLQYHSLCLVAAFSISPVLLVQHSVSYTCFIRTFLILFPYWVLMSLLWGLSYHALLHNQSSRHFILQVVLIFVIFVPPFCLSVGILRRWIVSRVQLGSRSNRSSSEYLFVYSVIFFVLNCVNLFTPNVGFHAAFAIDLTLVIVDFSWNMLFTLALHRSLLADTKFWRGIGTHNQGGLNQVDRLDDSTSQLPKPSIDVRTASFAFQDMMNAIGKIVIDFAYLEVKQRIGDGATSKVFNGAYRKDAVAIKISTPTEITSEVIDVFVKEAMLSQSLQHQNIVKFYGLCVRPPQIAMVMELCSRGNLKSSIAKLPTEWTTMRRLNACLGASRALKYMHTEGYIHRDIKTENFFVTEGWRVKLGDFGESRKQEVSRDSLGGRRMTILGTVSYMAPELVAASKFYTTSVDIFALAITFWEIWTGLNAYGDRSQFEVYKMVESGHRPDISNVEAPAGFLSVMKDAWQQDPDARPEADEIEARLEDVIRELGGQVEPEVTVQIRGTSSVVAQQGPVKRIISSMRNQASQAKTQDPIGEFNSSFVNRLTDLEERKTDVRVMPLGPGSSFSQNLISSKSESAEASSSSTTAPNSSPKLGSSGASQSPNRFRGSLGGGLEVNNNPTLTPLLPTHFERDSDNDANSRLTLISSDVYNPVVGTRSSGSVASGITTQLSKGTVETDIRKQSRSYSEGRSSNQTAGSRNMDEELGNRDL